MYGSASTSAQTQSICLPCVANCLSCTTGQCDACNPGYSLSTGLCLAVDAQLVEPVSIYYILATVVAITLIAMTVHMILLWRHWGDALHSAYFRSGLINTPSLFAGLFHLVSDALFILVVYETDSTSIYFYLAVAFAVVPFVINVVVALWIGVRNGAEAGELSVWFLTALCTFCTGDFVQSLVFMQTLLALIQDRHKDYATRAACFEAGFGSERALSFAIGMFLVQLCLRDLPHLSIQASFLQAHNSINVIVVLALAATAVMTVIGLFSFLFFTLAPLQTLSKPRSSRYKGKDNQGSNADLLYMNEITLTHI